MPVGPSWFASVHIPSRRYRFTLTMRTPTVITPTAACAFSVASGAPPHSTGKERDTESGNDYFLARYYNSATGRFLSPDWSAKVEPVPYAKLGDPQSLNLYSYVENNPMDRFDPDGHEVDLDNKKDSDRKKTAKLLTSNTSKAERGLFTTSTDPKTGKTTLVLTGNASSFKGEHTVAYNRLAGAIENKNVLTVGIHDQYVDRDGKTMNTPAGGITVPTTPPGVPGDVHIYLNSMGMGAGDFSRIPGVEPGSTISAPMNIIAAHEVMGHGYQALTGGHRSEVDVRQIENIMREQEGLDGPRPLVDK
jgi:RHS repeat-associated protein